MSQSYRSDLTDEQWEIIQTLIPPAKLIKNFKTIRREKLAKQC